MFVWQQMMWLRLHYNNCDDSYFKELTLFDKFSFKAFLIAATADKKSHSQAFFLSFLKKKNKEIK